jgi:hypothetical protein
MRTTDDDIDDINDDKAGCRGVAGGGGGDIVRRCAHADTDINDIDSIVAPLRRSSTVQQCVEPPLGQPNVEQDPGLVILGVLYRQTKT